ncbi:hypothetical protein ERJ75_001151700 [Trypanosoma vivax]|nr:hypothetical protein ERJ75_001151700 [Trypanosoma vivax]
MSGALKLDVLREGRSQALLGAKARAGVPGRTKHGAAMGLDPAAKGVGNSLVGSWRLRAPLLEERRSVVTGGAPHSFGQQTQAMGDAPPTLKPLRAPARDVATAKAPSHDPNTADLASEANRADNGMRTGTAWKKRMPTIRRFGAFAGEDGLEMSGVWDVAPLL